MIATTTIIANLGGNQNDAKTYFQHASGSRRDADIPRRSVTFDPRTHVSDGATQCQHTQARIHSDPMPLPVPVRSLEPLPSKFFPERIQRIRGCLYCLLEEPESSACARFIHIFILNNILLAILAFVLETMPELKGIDPLTWFVLEVFFTSVFSIEYFLRLATATAFGTQTTTEFVLRIMNICDLLAILPFFIELIGRSSDGHVLRILRAVRLFRLFRVLKLGRYSVGMRIMAETVRRSSSALWVLAFFVGVAVVLFSSIVWYMEKFQCPQHRDDWSTLNHTEYFGLCRDTIDGFAGDYGLCCTPGNSPSNFPSIVHAFWWAIVSLSTVGYGDVVPLTSAGRVFGILAMFSGILVIALPVAIIGSKFQEVYQEVEISNLERIRQKSSPNDGFTQPKQEANGTVSFVPTSTESMPSSGQVSFEEDWVVAASSLRGRTANSNASSLSRLTSLSRMGRSKTAQIHEVTSLQAVSSSPVLTSECEPESISQMSRRLIAILKPDKMNRVEQREIHKLCKMLDRCDVMRINVHAMHKEECHLHKHMKRDFQALISVLCGGDISTGKEASPTSGHDKVIASSDA